MRFSTSATWRGIALYEFHADGRLLSADVEQDFWGRRRQFRGLSPGREVGTTDPAVWGSEAQRYPLEQVDDVRRTLEALTEADAEFDDGSPLVVVPDRIEVADTIMSGSRFAARLHAHGRYLADPDGPDLSLSAGDTIKLTATGIGSIDTDGSIRDGHFVTDRYGLWLQNRAPKDVS